MNLGYYFHANAAFSEDGDTARVEAFFAAFVRMLAANAGEGTFYAHAGAPDETHTGALRPSDRVTCINLGHRPPRPLMYLWPRRPLRAFDPKAQRVDAVLVRGPTALLPAIDRRCRRAGIPMVGLLVADNRNWRPTVAMPAWRNRLIQIWHWVLACSQARVARHALMLAVSKSIVRDRAYRRTAIVQTTSLTDADLTGPDNRERSFPVSGPVRLFYAGRVVEEKGLFDLIEALALLVSQGRGIELELVGGQFGDATLTHLLARAEELRVKDRITVTGYIEAGPQLLDAYRRSDIFVLPTHGEGGVNHALKEAFATGTPVVTTSIREITEFLQNREHAVLVPRRDPQALAAGIAEVIDDAKLRAHIAQRGFAWVQEFTMEACAQTIVDHIRMEIARTR